MIEYCKANLFEIDAEALVNTVNCVGVMGKGIALQFKKAYPQNFKEYEKACKAGEVVPGKMFIHSTGKFINPKYIINFPTKRHWKGASKLEDIQLGLVSLAEDIKALGIKSIVVPPLGCGYGGLNWDVVQPLIERELSALENVRIIVIQPAFNANFELPKLQEKPKLTRSRALYILLMKNYIIPGYELTLLELQKLAYFLQVLGEPLRLNFKRHHYGPYADNLNKVLEVLEGHYISGYTGDRAPTAEIRLLPSAVEEAEEFLNAASEDYFSILDSLIALIEGFEEPYGMELLSTVHWLIKEDPSLKDDPQAIVDQVQAWNSRKKKIFKQEDILLTLAHLKASGIASYRDV